MRKEKTEKEMYVLTTLALSDVRGNITDQVLNLRPHSSTPSQLHFNITPSTLHPHLLTPSPDHVGCYGSHAIVVVVLLRGELLRAQSVGGDNLEQKPTTG